MAIEITGRINFDATSVDEATQSVKDLQQEVEKTSTTLDQDLQNSFENVRNATDLLGGSVATVVGGLALLGIENEYIDNLTQGAAGALAFASGVDQLGRGLTGFAKNTKVAAAAQRIFNVVLNANPVVLIATAIIGLGAAVFALTRVTRENTAAEEENVRARELNVEIVERLRDAEDRLARVRAASRTEELQLDLGVIDKQIASLERAISLTNENDVNFANFQKQLQVLETERLIVLERINKEEVRIAEDREKREVKRREEETKTLNQAIENNRKRVEDNLLSTQIENDTLQERGLVIQGLLVDVAQFEEKINGLSAAQADSITNFTDLLEEGLQSTSVFAADTFSFIGDLAEGFTKDEDKRARRSFQIQKAAAIVQTVIGTIDAAQRAFASQIIPGDPSSVPRAIGAATLASVQGAARVAAISRQQFQSNAGAGSVRPSTTGAGPNSGVTSATPQFNLFGTGATTIGGPGADSLNGNQNGQLVRAFVSETDLTNTNTRLALIRNGSEL